MVQEKEGRDKEWFGGICWDTFVCFVYIKDYIVFDLFYILSFWPFKLWNAYSILYMHIIKQYKLLGIIHVLILGVFKTRLQKEYKCSIAFLGLTFGTIFD